MVSYPPKMTADHLLFLLAPTLAITAVIAVPVLLFCLRKRKWLLRLGGVLLAMGFLAPLLLQAFFDHPGDRSDIGMKGTILMLVFFPAGLLVLGLGLLCPRPRTPPPARGVFL